jgi:hypothetical protein
MRGAAAIGLGQLGPKAAPAVPALIRALSDESQKVRRLAAGSLGRIGLPAGSAVPELTRALSAEDAAVRRAATEALGLIGAPSGVAVPRLIEALSDRDRWVRRSAAKALGTLKAARSASALIAALEDERLVTPAVLALEKIGEPAIPALVLALSHREETVRGLVAERLKRIGFDLKVQGRVVWWVVPYAYGKEAAGVVFLLAAWFVLLARFPKRRLVSATKRLGLMGLAAASPVVVACSAVFYATTRDWAEGFLPDTLTLVPFPVAAVLSTALVMTLLTLWACQRARESYTQPEPAYHSGKMSGSLKLSTILPVSSRTTET